VPHGTSSVAVPTVVTLEVEPIAAIIVVASGGLFPSVFATVLTSVVTIRVAEPAVVPVTCDLAILKIWPSISPWLRGSRPCFLFLHLFLF
jgi:hypothetical protein